MPSVSDAATLDGKLFQMSGRATKNARSPIVERRDDGITRADVDAAAFLRRRPPHVTARSPDTVVPYHVDSKRRAQLV